MEKSKDSFLRAPFIRKRMNNIVQDDIIEVPVITNFINNFVNNYFVILFNFDVQSDVVISIINDLTKTYDSINSK